MKKEKKLLIWIEKKVNPYMPNNPKVIFLSDLKMRLSKLIEDNPVPSLVNELSWFKLGTEFGHKKTDEQILEQFNHLKKLQNGVETDNEQPKCHKFEDGNYLCSTCKNVCTITGEKIPELLNRFDRKCPYCTTELPCNCGGRE